jgi:hypothetical protein
MREFMRPQENERSIMKKKGLIRKFLAAALTAVTVLTAAMPVTAQAATAASGFKGVWISFLDIQTYLFIKIFFALLLLMKHNHHFVLKQI